jgi:hypothetical protein
MAASLLWVVLTALLSLPSRNGSSDDDITGEKNPTGAAQESAAGTNEPRAVDIARVGWSPYYFGK